MGNFIAKKRNNGIEENTANPLDNPLILSIVAKHCDDVEDLKGFLLVSRLWRDIFLEQWRASATLRIKKKGNVIRGKLESGNGIDFGDVLSFAKDDGLDNSQSSKEIVPKLFFDKPFQKHKISFPIHLPPSSAPTPDVREVQYWTLYGPHLKSLSLDYVVVNEDGIIEGMKWIFEHCPNLKHLEMAPYAFNFNSPPPSEEPLEITGHDLESFSILTCPNTWVTMFEVLGYNYNIGQMFLAMVPKLKTLIIKDYPEPEELLKALSLPLLNGKTEDDYAMLEKILISGRAMSSDSVEYLGNYMKRGCPPLKELAIAVNSKNLKNLEEHVKNIFTPIRGSLENLQLEVYFEDNDSFAISSLLHGISFPNVADLSVKLFSTDEHSIDAPLGWNLIWRSFPALKKFKYFFNHSRRSPFSKQDLLQEIVPNYEGFTGESAILENLHEFCVDCGFNNEALEKLSKLMPNLRILQMEIEKEENIARVLSLFPKLRLFKVFTLKEVHKDSLSRLSEKFKVEIKNEVR